MTLDEQLIHFYGKCPFRMYIPKKLNKYNIKIIMLYDNITHYIYNAMPYLGKDIIPNSFSANEFFVNKLVIPIKNSK